nr:hypothetical protein [Tanacetum cinerariifolium]
MTLKLANRAICTPDGIARDVFVPVGKFTFPADFVVVDYESDPRVPLILGRPFLRTARALIDVHGEKMILRDGDESLTLNMKHDTASYSNHPHRELVNLINIFNLSSEDCLEDLVSNKKSGNPTFSLHKEIASDIHPHFDDDPLSGSTTYSANSLLEEFADELALILYPLDYDDNQMFTDEQPPDYSFPPRFDVYLDDFLKIESDDTFDDFSRDDVLPSLDNEEKVFNPGILSHEKSVKINTQEKKLAVSYASWLFEGSDPLFYELFVFKEVLNSMRLLPFSSENEEKVFKPGIYTSKKFHCCFLFELSHPDGKCYYVAFTDNFSRYGYVYLITHKSDTFEVFKRYQNEVENQLGRNIKDCEVFIRREAQDKLEAISEKCLFVGYQKESFRYLFYKPKDNVLFVARRGVFLEREMISKEDSGSKIDLEEIHESADEEPIVNTDTQQEAVTPVEPDDISLPIRRISGRVGKPLQFCYGFHNEEDKITDSTLSELDESANYKEAMASPKAANLKTVGCKWIFKKKTGMDGKLHTYKARLIAKGYTKTHGIDYEETFSLVAKIKSIRIMLVIATFHDYKIWQIDVNAAFLNRKLTEDVFMAQPEGFENAKSNDESCIYVKVGGSVVVFLVLYVDDILLIGNDIPTLQSVKDWLGKCFAMKDLGDATYILGIKIYRDGLKCLIGLSHDTYFDKILKRFKMENSKKGNLPLHHGIKICKDLCLKTNEELDRISQVLYDLAEGSIMYAMTYTRPDVSFALSKKSSKQYTMADSTCESKYIAACEASKESIWMKNFIGDLRVVPTVQDPIEIFYNNESAVALTKEPKDHRKLKHIERKYHFV